MSCPDRLVPSPEPFGLPAWVPDEAARYLHHTQKGHSLRAVARQAGLHPSTILRQIRRIEARRDDPQVDEILDRLADRAQTRPPSLDHTRKDHASMTAMTSPARMIDDETLSREGRRILRRLCEADAVMVVSPEMEKAVVLRQPDGGTPTRTAVLPRMVAQAFVLKDWVSCFAAGRITRYRITEAGKAALRRMLAEEHNRKVEARGMAEAPSPFLTQNVEWGERAIPTANDDLSAEVLRVNLAESPLGSLARKKDRAGKPFLSLDLVAAGDRLREDFEAAQMGARVAQNWDRFLTPGDRGGFDTNHGPASGPTDARARVAAALKALGPGLGDVVLRVCCFLEGLETAEKRMGWSARSGKVVLRIALQRLRAHYDGV